MLFHTQVVDVVSESTFHKDKFFDFPDLQNQQGICQKVVATPATPVVSSEGLEGNHEATGFLEMT